MVDKDNMPERVWINNEMLSGAVLAYASPMREAPSGKPLSIEFIRADVAAATLRAELAKKVKAIPSRYSMADAIDRADVLAILRGEKE